MNVTIPPVFETNPNAFFLLTTGITTSGTFLTLAMFRYMRNNRIVVPSSVSEPLFSFRRRFARLPAGADAQPELSSPGNGTADVGSFAAQEGASAGRFSGGRLR